MAWRHKHHWSGSVSLFDIGRWSFETGISVETSSNIYAEDTQSINNTKSNSSTGASLDNYYDAGDISINQSVFSNNDEFGLAAYQAQNIILTTTIMETITAGISNK
jgi:hypothetical protein